MTQQASLAPLSDWQAALSSHHRRELMFPSQCLCEEGGAWSRVGAALLAGGFYVRDGVGC